MSAMRFHRSFALSRSFHQTGASMLEVLVSIVVVAIGLLGLAGLQLKMQSADMEAYQRTQALMLLQDMADRISVNRSNLAAYAGLSLGTGATAPTCNASSSRAEQDLCEWNDALLGASETVSGGAKVGAMIGARGCTGAVTTDASGARQIVLTVAWQGQSASAIPSVTCGENAYSPTDAYRRTVTTIVTIGTLS